LDSYGSPTSLLSNNLLSRGETNGVKQAVEVRGRFDLVENQFHGFDEPDSAALGLYPDRFGRQLRNAYRRNTFGQCANVFAESEEGLWKAADIGETAVVPGATAAGVQRSP
jgi:hypothetical protein